MLPSKAVLVRAIGCMVGAYGNLGGWKAQWADWASIRDTRLPSALLLRLGSSLVLTSFGWDVSAGFDDLGTFAKKYLLSLCLQDRIVPESRSLAGLTCVYRSF